MRNKPGISQALHDFANHTTMQVERGLEPGGIDRRIEQKRINDLRQLGSRVEFCLRRSGELSHRLLEAIQQR